MNMKKRDLIEQIKNLIINRITLHAPKLQNVVDCSSIKALDIDERYPIFIYEKPLDNLYYQAFLQAQKQCKFNLILREIPKINGRLIKKLDRVNIILKGELGPEIESALKRLNANYQAKSDYKVSEIEERVIINNQKIPFDFIPFYNNKKLSINGVLCNIKQFILNGKNYLFEFVNCRDNANIINFEVNIPLPLGYYIFSQTKNRIDIENLTSKEKGFFNYFADNLNFNFSLIKGLACSTFSCINFKGKVELKPREKKVLFFNFGHEKMQKLNPKEMLEYFDYSQKEMFKLFPLQITSKNAKFDSEFNHVLPKKIWSAWNNFSSDHNSENKWLMLKNQIIKNNLYGIEILDNFNLREVKLFQQNQWKRVFIMHGDSQYIFAGKVKYFNLKYISNEFFNKNNEIYLSFC